MGNIVEEEEAIALSRMDLVERERQLVAIDIIKRMQLSKYYYCGLFDHKQFMRDIAKAYNVRSEVDIE